MSMPQPRQMGHRIRAGLQTVASFSASHEVAALPLQSDQYDVELIPWVLDQELTTPPKPAQIVTFGDLSRGPDGFFTWQWGFTFFTFGMTNYWDTTFLPSGVESAPVTVMTYDRYDVAKYLQATMIRPQLPGDGTPILGGWSQIIYRFEGGVIIT